MRGRLTFAGTAKPLLRLTGCGPFRPPSVRGGSRAAPGRVLMHRPLPFAAAALALVLFAFPTGAVRAQTGSTNPSGFSSASDSIPEDKLDKAAAAIEQVAQLHLKYE